MICKLILPSYKRHGQLLWASLCKQDLVLHYYLCTVVENALIFKE